jgi:Zn-dependent protease with chaperone function
MISLEISKKFKIQVVKSILAISLFVVVYLLILTVSIIIAYFTSKLVFDLLVSNVNILTIIILISVLTVNLYTMYYLGRFFFRKSKFDLSNLIEIKPKDQPLLFDLIEQIVAQTATNLPKRVFLSPDVNAGVFYDSSFLSLFIRTQKNLYIGMGLINTLNSEELKSILAHEFGHFSQKSMRLGSYVYYVNRIIYSLLYEGMTSEELEKKLSSSIGLVALLGKFIFWTISSIKWIFHKIYIVVNLSYLSLSKEMEYHADSVSASLVGPEVFRSALLRSNLSEAAYNEILKYYDNKIKELKTTQNIYPQQQFAMIQIATAHDIPIENNLPKIAIQHINRYNRSKLVIKDQWSSHPDTSDRLAHIANFPEVNINSKEILATSLVKDLEIIQIELTKKIFATVQYSGQTSAVGLDEFNTDFEMEIQNAQLPKDYNNYYDNREPMYYDVLSELTPGAVSHQFRSIADVFSDEYLEKVLTSNSIQNDMQVLEQIKLKYVPVKTFDYAGVKYAQKDCHKLIKDLENTLNTISEEIKKHEENIYQFFKSKAQLKGLEEEYNEKTKAMFELFTRAARRSNVYNDLINESEFFYRNLQYHAIRSKLSKYSEFENNFIIELRQMMQPGHYLKAMSEEARKAFENYLNGSRNYFEEDKYNNEALQLLIEASNHFMDVVFKTHFKLKKDFLEYQLTLL